MTLFHPPSSFSSLSHCFPSLLPARFLKPRGQNLVSATQSLSPQRVRNIGFHWYDTSDKITGRARNETRRLQSVPFIQIPFHLVNTSGETPPLIEPQSGKAASVLSSQGCCRDRVQLTQKRPLQCMHVSSPLRTDRSSSDHYSCYSHCSEQRKEIWQLIARHNGGHLKT
jgi:hypothetical protein